MATKQTNMRLKPDVLADLDMLTERKKIETGIDCSRVDVVSILIREAASKVKEEKPKAKKAS